MVESKKNRITEVSDFLVICRGEGIRTLHLNMLIISYLRKIFSLSQPAKQPN